MARAFRRKGDRFVATFDEMERAVVAGLMEQTRDLIAPPEADEAPPPDADTFDRIVAGLDPAAAPVDTEDRDPALDRLLPTAHRGDEEIAAEFRRLTEHGLRDRKAATLATAVQALRSGSGDRLVLTRQEAEAVLVALTDTRLVLGERLGLRTDDDALTLADRVSALDPDDPAVYAASLYDFLTWMQESLSTAMLGRGLFS